MQFEKSSYILHYPLQSPLGKGGRIWITLTPSPYPLRSCLKGIGEGWGGVVQGVDHLNRCQLKILVRIF
jgi:hypothetical protein